MEDAGAKRYKKCYNCRYYDACYTKGQSRFHRQDFGYCTVQKKLISKGEECGRWASAFRRTALRKRAAKSALLEILSELRAIRQIIEEDENENAAE